MRKGLEFTPQQMPDPQSQLGELVGGRGRKHMERKMEHKLRTYLKTQSLHQHPQTHNYFLL